MSTLVSTYLQDRASGKKVDTLTVVDGVPKAYAAFNGITMVAMSTMGLSSIHDDASGQWSLIFTAPFNSWCCMGGSSHNSGVTFNLWSGITNNGAQSTMTSYPLGSTTQTDSSNVSALVTGRLA